MPISFDKKSLQKASLKTLIRARTILEKFNYSYDALRNTPFGQNVLKELNTLFVHENFGLISQDFTDSIHIKNHREIESAANKLVTFLNNESYLDVKTPHPLVKNLINLHNIDSEDILADMNDYFRVPAIKAGIAQLGIFILEMMGVEVKAAFSSNHQFAVIFLPRFFFNNLRALFYSKPVLFIDFSIGEVKKTDLLKLYSFKRHVYILKGDKTELHKNYARFRLEHERRFSPILSNLVITGYFNKEKSKSQAEELKEMEMSLPVLEVADRAVDYNLIWKQGEGYVNRARETIDRYENYVLNVISGFSQKEFLKELNELKNTLNKVWKFMHTLHESQSHVQDGNLKTILSTLHSDLLEIAKEVIYLEAFITNVLRKERDRYVSALGKLKHIPAEQGIDQEKLDELEYLEARFSDACGIVAKMDRLFTPDLPSTYFDFDKITQIIKNLEHNISASQAEVTEKKQEALAIFSENFSYPITDEKHQRIIDYCIEKLLVEGCGFSRKGTETDFAKEQVSFNKDSSGLISLITAYIAEKLSVSETDGTHAEISRHIDEFTRRDRIIIIIKPVLTASLDTTRSYERLVEINQIKGHAGGYNDGSVYLILSDSDSKIFENIQHIHRETGKELSELITTKKLDKENISLIKALVHRLAKVMIHETGAHMGLTCERNRDLEHIISGTYTADIKKRVDDELYDQAIKRAEETHKKERLLAHELFSDVKMTPQEFVSILSESLLPVPNNDSVQEINRCLKDNSYDNQLDDIWKDLKGSDFFLHYQALVEELISHLSLVELRKIIEKHLGLNNLPQNIKQRTKEVNEALVSNLFNNLLPIGVIDKRLDYT